MAALEMIIQQFEEALKATPENHPDRAGQLQYLGGEYCNRYQRTGAETDLKKAIQHSEEALKAVESVVVDCSYKTDYRTGEHSVKYTGMLNTQVAGPPATGNLNRG